VYLPLAQCTIPWRVLQIRTSASPESLRGRVQAAKFQALDPEMPIADLQTMSNRFAGGQDS